MTDRSHILRPVALLAGVAFLVSAALLVRDQYQLHLAQLIGAYWILIAGLNLVVGYTGPAVDRPCRAARRRRLRVRDPGRPATALDPCWRMAVERGRSAACAASCSGCRRCGCPASISPWRRWPSPLIVNELSARTGPS